MVTASPVISVHDLHKSYGAIDAVRGIDITIDAGEIFAFLGPNGAGKTTTVEILEGYRTPSSGTVSVLGVDPAHADAAWRARVGVVLQTCELYRLLTARESLEQYAGYYAAPRSVDATLEVVGLTEAAEQRVAKLSGGQQRRLDVALALVGDPELLFLDEPTTGFDPAARRDAWEMISSLRDLGKTVFLTTHYMDEAQALADRVAIIKAGRIVAEGRPDDLTAEAGGGASTVRFALPPGVTAADLPSAIGSRVTAGDGRLQLTTTTAVADLAELCRWSLDRAVNLVDLEVSRPSLEDVYLNLTAGAE